MENRFDNRDFERIVRQNADQFRMFPSDNVWNGIHSALHKRRRWYGIGLALLLITTATVTIVMLMPGYQNVKLASLGQAVSEEKITGAEKKTAVVNFLETPKATTATSIRNYPTQLKETFLDNNNIEAALPAGDEAIIADIKDMSPDILTAPDPVTIAKPAAIERNLAVVQPNKLNRSANASRNPDRRDDLKSNNELKDIVAVTEQKKADSKKESVEEKRPEEKLILPPFTIESVVNSYSLKKARKKLDWEFFFTPTISYRTLTENTEFISATRYNSIMNGTGNNTNPVYYSTDVNSVVNHKPDAGMQVGIRAAYPVSKWFSFTGGVQLSVSKYDIKASQHTAEVATIDLMTRNTLSPVTSYRNGNGGQDNWLRNFYFSASLPIGMELKLSDGSRNYFGVGTTLQPTFVLDNRAYLISTDYKNYAEVPSLTRKFNMNTSFEIFSAHTTGKVHWRIGPQIHYQMMSSFIKNYPIKEHLFDFGLKLGVRL
jgi:hypothetical protein